MAATVIVGGKVKQVVITLEREGRGRGSWQRKEGQEREKEKTGRRIGRTRAIGRETRPEKVVKKECGERLGARGTVLLCFLVHSPSQTQRFGGPTAPWGERHEVPCHEPFGVPGLCAGDEVLQVPPADAPASRCFDFQVVLRRIWDGGSLWGHGIGTALGAPHAHERRQAGRDVGHRTDGESCRNLPFTAWKWWRGCSMVGSGASCLDMHILLLDCLSPLPSGVNKLACPQVSTAQWTTRPGTGRLWEAHSHAYNLYPWVKEASALSPASTLHSPPQPSTILHIPSTPQLSTTLQFLQYHTRFAPQILPSRTSPLLQTPHHLPLPLPTRQDTSMALKQPLPAFLDLIPILHNPPQPLTRGAPLY